MKSLSFPRTHGMLILPLSAYLQGIDSVLVLSMSVKGCRSSRDRLMAGFAGMGRNGRQLVAFDNHVQDQGVWQLQSCSKSFSIAPC